MFNNLYNYLSDPDNWCKPQDRSFYKLYLLFVVVTIYILVGTYLYDPNMLRIFFWPLQ